MFMECFLHQLGSQGLMCLETKEDEMVESKARIEWQVNGNEVHTIPVGAIVTFKTENGIKLEVKNRGDGIGFVHSHDGEVVDSGIVTGKKRNG